MSRHNPPNRWRDRDSDRRNRQDRPERPERGQRQFRPPRAEPRETLEQIEQRPRFEPRPPDWGRPVFALGQRVRWNFLYKLSNCESSRGTITRVGETCDIRWDDGLETLFLPPVVILPAGETDDEGDEAAALTETDAEETAADPGSP